MTDALNLKKSEFLSDWWVLEGGDNWAAVEGSSSEWRAIRDGLSRIEKEVPAVTKIMTIGEQDRFKTPDLSVSFRRCAIRFGHVPNGVGHNSSWVELYSPRNATGESDCIRVPVGGPKWRALVAMLAAAGIDRE